MAYEKKYGSLADNSCFHPSEELKENYKKSLVELSEEKQQQQQNFQVTSTQKNNIQTTRNTSNAVPSSAQTSFFERRQREQN